jgi:hypothetical protein
MRARFDCGVCGTPRQPMEPCIPCRREGKRTYKLRHATKVKAAAAALKKRRWAAGAEMRAVKRAARKATVRDRRICARRKWKRANPGAVNASTAKRWAQKFHAMPAWANHFFMEEAYSLARLRSRVTGFEWHVDHEIPLRSKSACGLHTHDNLRVIPAIDNMRKGNRYSAASSSAPSGSPHSSESRGGIQDCVCMAVTFGRTSRSPDHTAVRRSNAN